MIHPAASGTRGLYYKNVTIIKDYHNGSFTLATFVSEPVGDSNMRQSLDCTYLGRLGQYDRDMIVSISCHAAQAAQGKHCCAAQSGQGKYCFVSLWLALSRILHQWKQSLNDAQFVVSL